MKNKKVIRLKMGGNRKTVVIEIIRERNAVNEDDTVHCQ